MSRELIFIPLVPIWLLGALVIVTLVMAGLAMRWHQSGWWLRLIGFLGIICVLCGPVLRDEIRKPLNDIVVLLVDETASQDLANRPAQIARARAEISEKIAQIPNTELRVVTLRDSDDDRGSLLMARLNDALGNEPRGRISGIILLSDGQLHDAGVVPEIPAPAPVHLYLTGEPTDWDRRLIVENAPSFAILGEEIILKLRVEDQGAVPDTIGKTTQIVVAIDGGTPQTFEISVGRTIEVPLTLPHGGRNVFQFTLPQAEGELTAKNNSAVVEINGIRDRLRVLLVSGEPHNGERTWRNLLKSDASVDLVHFTILRPREKQDGVPNDELSLIPFPTRELFMEKVDDFDLIIFDRYKLRGILPPQYFENIARFVDDGGAVLFATGPDFATTNSLYRSPLARIMPVIPTGQVIEQGYLPRLTDIGLRHPVTAGLTTQNLDDPSAQIPDWGRWFRQVDVEATRGHTVMTGADGRPLLVLDQVNEGRVAVLTSDHAWLWSRGVEGGGPQLELLRRLAHWMMKEPDLEEEALNVTVEGTDLIVTRQTMSDDIGDVTLETPDGTRHVLPMIEAEAGHFSARFTSDASEDMGLYRVSDGVLKAVAVVGPAAPREFIETVATGEKMLPVFAQMGITNPSIHHLSNGVPDVKRMAKGQRVTSHSTRGKGWIGLTPRGAYETQSTAFRSLIPMWLWLIGLSGVIILAWLREARRL